MTHDSHMRRISKSSPDSAESLETCYDSEIVKKS